MQFKKRQELIGKKYFCFKYFEANALIEAGCNLEEVQVKDGGRKVFVFTLDDKVKTVMKRLQPDVLYM